MIGVVGGSLILGSSGFGAEGDLVLRTDSALPDDVSIQRDSDLKEG